MEAFGDTDVVDSEFLSGAEAGAVALTVGDWDAALTHLHRAAAGVEDIESRALAGTERLSETLSSWALNDTAIAYRGEGFERVYVHCGLAMAYLAQGQLDSVYVEARRSNELLEAEEKLYEKEYRAGGLGHLMSALAYELLGELDDAYIDYERMEAKGVGTALAGKALMRLAKQLHREDEYERWEERYGPDLERSDQAASIVVVAGIGLAPFKVESSLALPTEDGVISMAVPGYRRRPQPVSGLRLLAVEAGVDVHTTTIEDVSTVAEENLSDRLGWMAAKSVARGLAKRELTKKLEDEAGLAGRIAGDLFSLATERADLRCWQTLPDSWHAARLFVPSGRHTLELEALGGETLRLGTFEVDPGETVLVFARTVGTGLYAHPIGGLLIEPAEAASPAQPLEENEPVDDTGATESAGADEPTAAAGALNLEFQS